MSGNQNGKHFVLVHGAGGGSWVWYKVKHRLKAAGHHVTVVDMAASGQHPKSLNEVHTFKDYNEPLMELMESLEENERIILVGHSLGGMNLAFAMENYPHKISVGVFIAAVLPDTSHHLSHVLEKLLGVSSKDAGVDCGYSWQESIMWVHFGPKYLAQKIYNLSPLEDLELAKILYRPGSLFAADLANAEKMSNERYGSVNRVYMVCDNDQVMTQDLQRWIIQFSGIEDVIEINGSDHMPMASKPEKLCHHLIEIAHKYT